MGGLFAHRARPSAELALACIGLGVLIGYGLAVLFGATRSRPPAPEQGGWVLAVSMTFKSAEDLAEFERIFRPVADHVRAREPTTLAYSLLKSDKDPLTVMVFEKYEDKEHAYLQVHKSSAPFLAFRPRLAALAPVITGQSYDVATW